MRFFSYLFLAFYIFGIAGANAADYFSVQASEIYVIDGDTVALGESRYRLAGIDACEHGQQAISAEGRYFDCGAVGREFLQSLLSGNVKISVLGRDRYGRYLAVLYSQSGQDINAWMVLSGWAVAYYSDRYPETRHYSEISNSAQTRESGLWAGAFVIPSEHRKYPDAMPSDNSPSFWTRLFAYILSF